MQSHHRETIRKNWVKLSQEAPVESLLAYFYQEGIFKQSTVQDILWEKPSQRSWAFLDNLHRSGPRAFEIFVKALKDCGKQDLAILLQDGDSL